MAQAFRTLFIFLLISFSSAEAGVEDSDNNNDTTTSTTPSTATTSTTMSTSTTVVSSTTSTTPSPLTTSTTATSTTTMAQSSTVAQSTSTAAASTSTTTTTVSPSTQSSSVTTNVSNPVIALPICDPERNNASYRKIFLLKKSNFELFYNIDLKKDYAKVAEVLENQLDMSVVQNYTINSAMMDINYTVHYKNDKSIVEYTKCIPRESLQRPRKLIKNETIIRQTVFEMPYDNNSNPEIIETRETVAGDDYEYKTVINSTTDQFSPTTTTTTTKDKNNSRKKELRNDENNITISRRYLESLLESLAKQRSSKDVISTTITDNDGYNRTQVVVIRNEEQQTQSSTNSDDLKTDKFETNNGDKLKVDHNCLDYRYQAKPFNFYKVFKDKLALNLNNLPNKFTYYLATQTSGGLYCNAQYINFYLFARDDSTRIEVDYERGQDLSSFYDNEIMRICFYNYNVYDVLSHRQYFSISKDFIRCFKRAAVNGF